MNNRREPTVHFAHHNWTSFGTIPAAAAAACDRRAMVMTGQIDQLEQKAHLASCNWMLDCREVGVVVEDNRQGSNRTDRRSRMEMERILCSHVQEVVGEEEGQGQGCNNDCN